MSAAEWLNPQPVDAETVAIWADVNPNDWPHTPPLAVFEALMDDDNWWWRLDSGHHLNLYDSAIDERDRLRTAIEAVLALHVAVEVWEYDDVNGVWVYDEHGEKVPLPSVCRECTPRDTLLAIEDCEWTEDYESVGHPCDTVRAITAALDPS